MAGLNVTYSGTKADVVEHLTEQRADLVEQAATPRLGQQAKAKIDGEIAGLDRAIRLLARWTGPDGEAGK